MTRTTPAERSLINDAEFLEELTEGDHVSGHGPSASFERRPTYTDAFDALESGLPMLAGARPIPAPIQPQEPEPIADAFHDEPIAPLLEREVPFAAAALVIVACLLAGAATAAVVFHDRLTAITAAPTASR
jgi:hypothetical protein